MDTTTTPSRLPCPAGRISLTVLAPLVALVASAATLAQPAPMGDERGPAGGPPGMHFAMHRGPGIGGPGGPHGELPLRALDAVGATADQKAKLADIAKAAHADLRKSHDDGRKLHDELNALLAAPKVDAAAAEAVRQKLQAHRDAVSKRMLQARLEASAVLTAEQRQKLSDQQRQRQEMHERHRREREALDGPRS